VGTGDNGYGGHGRNFVTLERCIIYSSATRGSSWYTGQVDLTGVGKALAKGKARSTAGELLSAGDQSSLFLTLPSHDRLIYT
jgi:hypothetical protein